jgi:non-ribosomal peptide synthetase component F
LLYQELAALYEGICKGQPVHLPELSIQYADFAVWQRQYLQGETLDKLVTYWKRQLEGAPPQLALPTDHPRPPVQSLRGGKVFFVLPQALVEQANELSRQENVTQFMTLLAAFNVFLLGFTGQEDISLGSPIAGRNRVQTEALVGFFINTLLYRTRLSGNPTFRELQARVRELTLGAFAHQDMPFEKLVEVIGPPRDLSRNPLFQVNFRVANVPPAPLMLPGLTIVPLDLIDNATSKFDLALELGIWPGASSYWEYSTDLFDETTIHGMRADFEKLLAELLAQPQLPVAELATFRELNQKRQTKERAGPQHKSFRSVRRKAVNLP